MNKLSTADRAKILHLLVEGNSIRSTCRLTGASKNTVAKLLVDAGSACSYYQDKTLKNLKCARIQCDEIWSFCGAKERNATPEQKAHGWGDVWTWTAIDPDSKLIVCWFVGDRGVWSAKHFVYDLSQRLANRIQMTTDGHPVYLRAIENAFGQDVDYAMLVKIYGSSHNKTPEARYSPAVCMGAKPTVVCGEPEREHISTSHVERQNLSMRMGMRRFTRLTNAFSKKLLNHEAALALYFMYYNFARIHQTLRVTPAMEAGLTDHVWTMEEIVELLD